MAQRTWSKVLFQHVRLLHTCPSSVPEGRQGVQSGPEVPSWRWLQHMVNFHNYIVCQNCVYKLLSNKSVSLLCMASSSIVNFSLDCSTCVRPGVIVCTRRACGVFYSNMIIITSHLNCLLIVLIVLQYFHLFGVAL